MDDELIGHGIRAITGYAMGGGRLHGADIAPAIRHVGHKMVKVSKYMQLARAGYNLGRKVINSFSQKEKKKMPPLPTPPKTPSKRGGKYITSGEIKQLAALRRKLQYSMSKKPSGKQVRRKAGSGKVVKRKATGTVSSSRIRKARGRLGVHDYFCKRGVLMTFENGTFIQGTSTDKYQTVLVGHATHGVIQTLRAVALALVKSVLNHCQISFDNVNDALQQISTRNLVMRIEYRNGQAGAAQYYAYTISSSSTVSDIANALFTNVFSAFAEIILDEVVMYWAADNGLTQSLQICKLDLEKATLDLYSKSSLKIQNQTVGSSGNNEWDDVDNVPLYGKQYDGPGNYMQVEKTFISPLPTVTGNYYAQGYLSTSVLAEPQPLSVMKRAKRVGKIHLDPGHIKTSTLIDRRRISINVLLQLLTRSGVADNLCKIGKFRYFVMEKMLQSVGGNEYNGIKVHFEVDLKYGCICYIKKKTPLTMPVSLNPV